VRKWEGDSSRQFLFIHLSIDFEIALTTMRSVSKALREIHTMLILLHLVSYTVID